MKKRALIVASGGLDSTYCAAEMALKHDIELVHFLYGCRAEKREHKAVEDIASYFGVPHRFVPLPVWSDSSSPLMNTTSEIAQGAEGAAVAHEWVPARNLVMLSVATAIAEAEGFDFICIGANKEEAHAYPDNSAEFIFAYNDVLVKAISKQSKDITVLAPALHMRKSEIVRKGNAIQAPFHLTWSCYKQGELHCGDCGPCYMRKRAFLIAGHHEVIEYEV